MAITKKPRNYTDTMRFVNKDSPKFKDVVKRNWASVKTLGFDDPNVIIRWDISEKHRQHKLVQIIVGDQEFTVAVEELEQYLRVA